MSNRLEGVRAVCHQCGNEWDREHGGLRCPRCESEFVEIVRISVQIFSSDTDPDQLEPGREMDQDAFMDMPPDSPDRIPDLHNHPLHDLHDHNPWANAPDPDDGDITTIEFNNGRGRGHVTFTTRSYFYDSRQGGIRNESAIPPEITRNFSQMLNGMMMNPAMAARPGAGPQVFGGTMHFGSTGQGGFQQQNTFDHGPFPEYVPLPPSPESAPEMQDSPPRSPEAPRTFVIPAQFLDDLSERHDAVEDMSPLRHVLDRHSEEAERDLLHLYLELNFVDEDEADEIDSVFSNLFGVQGQQRGGPGAPPSFFDMLQTIFDPARAQAGDGVYTQEAFDRIMSNLMDQTQQNGAPPASADLIRNLPRKKVDKDMLGSDGTAECSICMDGVEVGTEVTSLPCKHWFHFECIESWLKEHDTCPHCRKPITPEDQQNSRPQQDRRRSSRRSSSVASPFASPSAGANRRVNPFAMPGPFDEGSQPNLRRPTSSAAATSMHGVEQSGIPDTPSGLRQARERFYGNRRNSEQERPSELPRRSSARDSGPDENEQGVGNGGIISSIRSRLPWPGSSG